MGKVISKKLSDNTDSGSCNKSNCEDISTCSNPELPIPVIISDNDKYDTSRSLNGCAIIFNFEEFKGHPNRVGSQKDVHRLSEMFKILNVDLPKDRIHKNLTYNAMVTKINEFKANTSLLSNSNALIIVILSHGDEGDQIMTYDDEFHLHKIINMFTAEELPVMAARPKIFLVQACRGDKVDDGVIVQNNIFEDSASMGMTFKYSNHADFCIAFSSHQEHVSFRDANGSWFIQEFCNVLEEIDFTQNHLLDVLAKTNAKVAERSSNTENFRYDNKKQISSFYSTFTKKFYLSRLAL